MTYRLKIGAGRDLPVILQAEECECGLASIAMVAFYHGNRFRLGDLRQRFPVSRRGASLASLIKIGNALKLDCRPLRLELENLKELSLPCIVHWDLNHFVVLKAIGQKRITIHDPATGVRSLGWKEFGKHFTGIALEMLPSDDFTKQDVRTPFSVRRLIGRISGLKRYIAQVLSLALGLEIVAVATPFYLQWLVDEALAAGDRDLVTILGTGFCLLVCLQAAIGAMRSWLVAVLSAQLNFQWLGRVFGHLLRLPTEYFEKRQVGGVLASFASINVIQETLTVAFAQAIVDGGLIIGTGFVMFAYNSLLSAAACASVALYAILRFVVFAKLRNAAAEEISFQARQSTHFLESLQGIQAIRLFGRGDERKITWMNLLADKFNAHLRVQKVQITQQATNVLLFGIERVIVIWLAGLLVLRNELTIGMLIAFLSYREQFSSRMAALVDKIFEFRMLGLHAERVAEVVDAAPEAHGPEHEAELLTKPDYIELRDISYAYSPHEDNVLDSVNLRIEAGECVAITGPSGSGKTTLVKILLGLLEPSSGEVRIGGRPLHQVGLQTFRRTVGTVMQDDMLFTGSLADNISFFDPTAEHAWIEECARQAAIHDEIMSMPMRYETLIGTIGVGLSGGQRQRILLARALYKRPQILVLDEATSHLDLDNERCVNHVVRTLRLTRIIIAHRAETIEAADRAIVVRNGRIQARGEGAKSKVSGDQPSCLASS
ncbi:peptidase domain-containing ABC transporter [Bradyrhizobium sp. CCBAU 53338]|uniref:peptidase domain-containing ABC transporter n=1 Tax=Bradyrhizobium sp. CCBAU 53338 TaxID=1325111 RepID=UPI00188AF6B7|nr:peptidase domain-containing ABC transporter [Bradyrhizobium sp. CCBAU 53338]QOZ51602.1 peptidase domain-containing ABC transporter [Bradyrhizobium sp. CCBAU 53338]